MNVSFLQIVIALTAGIAVIIFLTTRLKIHAFFALMIACFITGLIVQMMPAAIITIIKDGFGSIMRSLGFIIVLGTTLGVLLEHTGSTKVMASCILKKVGEKNTALALSITGFIIGLPVFCDSGYIVLSGLNKSLIRKTGMPAVVMSVSLATGLYSVHCLLPPHPGAAAAAGVIGVDFGKMILYGLMVAIPAMMAGYAWAAYAGKKIAADAQAEETDTADHTTYPSVIKAFLPVIIPIILIATASFLQQALPGGFISKLLVLGDPVIALSVGILLALTAKSAWNRQTMGHLLQESVEKAGGVLVIIGAGGAFGAVLAATKLGDHFGGMQALNTMGILFPFLLTAILKTAQGSSTVAIITAASIVQPLLSTLGLDTEQGKILCVLSMGAGSMMISHANDAYFWVISKFSGIAMKPMLRVYSVASICMGLVSLLMVYLLSLTIL